MDDVDIPELVESLGSTDDSVRKRAAFRLQGIIGDPSFADNFEVAGGLEKLRALALGATGNTLAYTLASFSRLLELDQGWSSVDQKLIGRLVQLVVAHPLVNILRGAMSILALVVAHPGLPSDEPGSFGFGALKPSIDIYPNFLEMLVNRLSSADHALCANAIQLINALMRDSITNDADDEWPKFIRRLQDLGVISAVYALMQSTSLQDLAQQLLEFQFLTKILLRKWREVAVDVERKEHRRALKAVYLASKQDKNEKNAEDGKRNNKDRDAEKWRKLGFETEMPAREFDEVGFLGMMDLNDFARKGEDSFHKLVLEQAAKTPARRCPLAKASLAVTSILYDHFEIDSAENEDHQRYVALESKSNFDKVFKPLLLQWSRLHTSGLQAFLRLWETTGAEIEDFYKIEELVRILIEHVVGLAPRTEDVARVEQDMANYELHRLRELQMELLELTHEDAWGHHLRQIKDDLHHEALQFIREQRTRCLLAGSWFPNISSHSSAYSHQPSSPLKSPNSASFRPSIESHLNRNMRTPPWRYVRLSHNRRFLHYADFDEKTIEAPSLDTLGHQVPLANVASVVSNVEAGGDAEDDGDAVLSEDIDAPMSLNRPSLTSDRSRAGTKRLYQHQPRVTHTTITLIGSPPPPTSTSIQDHQPTSRHRAPHHQANSPLKTTKPPAQQQQQQQQPSPTSPHQTQPQPQSQPQPQPQTQPHVPLLTLHLPTPTLASTWLDGLLLLLNQSPITAETTRLVEFIAKYGLKIRLLNVRFEEALVVRMGGVGGAYGGGVVVGGAVAGGGGMGAGGAAGGVGGAAGGGYTGGEVVLPGREGVDDDFFYDVAGA